MIWQRNVFYLALEELDIGRTRLPLVLSSKRQHIVGHVQSIRFARRPNPSRGEKYVDATAGTEV